MDSYNYSVSDPEIEQTPRLSARDWLAMFAALAAGMRMHIPIIYCLDCVVQMTPNARLRQALAKVRARLSDEKELAAAFASCGEVVDEACIQIMQNSTSADKLSTELSKYVQDRSPHPYLVAEQVKRSESVQKFTTQMAIELENNVPLAQALSKAITKATGDDQRALQEVLEEVKQNNTLGEAIRLQPHIFDPLYMKIVSTAELHGELPQAFALLAEL